MKTQIPHKEYKYTKQNTKQTKRKQYGGKEAMQMKYWGKKPKP